ncbi:MAG: hypothetical protein ACPGQL_01740 [Thermoplasmatota archaeon]
MTDIKKSLKAKDIERLENTSFATALIGGAMAGDALELEGGYERADTVLANSCGCESIQANSCDCASNLANSCDCNSNLANSCDCQSNLAISCACDSVAVNTCAENCCSQACGNTITNVNPVLCAAVQVVISDDCVDITNGNSCVCVQSAVCPVISEGSCVCAVEAISKRTDALDSLWEQSS